MRRVSRRGLGLVDRRWPGSGHGGLARAHRTRARRSCTWAARA